MTTETFAAPVVATHGVTDPAAPLVVLLHGRGSNETDIIGLAAHLPSGPQYAAVRAPLVEGGGYAWFANRGIGRPVAESLIETMAWVRGWLEDTAAGRPVVLVAQGDADAVIPRELLDRTWHYLHEESGAALTAHRDGGGHGLSPATVSALADWLARVAAAQRG